MWLERGELLGGGVCNWGWAATRDVLVGMPACVVLWLVALRPVTEMRQMRRQYGGLHCSAAAEPPSARLAPPLWAARGIGGCFCTMLHGRLQSDQPTVQSILWSSKSKLCEPFCPKGPSSQPSPVP
jgi:hypothetical protein